MGLSFRIKLGAYLSVVIFILFSLAMYFSYLVIQKSIVNNALSDTIQESVFRRSMIRDEYLLYREVVAKDRWITRKNEDLSLLQKAKVQFNDKDQLRDIEELILLTKDIDGIFFRILTIDSFIKDDISKYETFKDGENRLVSQLLLKDAEALKVSTHLLELTNSYTKHSYRTAIAIAIVFTLVVLSSTILNYWGISILLGKRKEAEDALQSAYDNLESLVNERTIDLRNANEELKVEADERKQAEKTLQEKVWFLNSLERIDRVIRKASDLEQMMEDVLNEILDILDVDRSWLFYPADVNVETWRIPMECSRPGYPGVSALGKSLPMLLEVQEVIVAALDSDSPVSFGIDGDFPLPDETSRPFQVQAQLLFAIYPKIDKPWLVGVHQCSRHRLWTEREKSLFQAMCGRIQDALTSLLFLRNLRESEERYRTLFEQSRDAIAIQEGLPPIFTWVNPSFCELFGYTAEEVYAVPSKDIWKFVHPDDRDLVRESLTKRMEGHLGEVFYSFRILRKDGTDRWVEVSGKRLQHDEHPMNLSIYRDTTERKLAEAALSRAKHAADIANKTKSEFLANMSHEIRTPLNGVMGMLQLLETTAPTDEQKEYLLAAIKSSKRLTRLLSDILDLSRIEADKLVFEEVEFEIINQKNSAIELFGVAARQKGLSLEFLIDERIPSRLIGDKTRLRQILFNLIGNGLKFTDKGSIRVEVSPLPSSSSSNIRILFTVADTGIGIPDNKIKDIFEPFVQADGSHIRKYQGAGLGLSIVRKLAKLMGGTLAIDSAEGSGTTFYISLPFRVPIVQQELVAQANRSTRVIAEFSTRILFAEDDETSLISGKKMLEKSGYTVVTAKDGQEALKLLLEQDFNLILMDIQMPIMDGVEAARAIRESAHFGYKSQIPIIAMTAYAMTGDKEKFMAAGMNDYISKPVSMEELKAVIERVMGKNDTAK